MNSVTRHGMCGKLYHNPLWVNQQQLIMQSAHNLQLYGHMCIVYVIHCDNDLLLSLRARTCCLHVFVYVAVLMSLTTFCYQTIMRPCSVHVGYIDNFLKLIHNNKTIGMNEHNVEIYS